MELPGSKPIMPTEKRITSVDPFAMALSLSNLLTTMIDCKSISPPPPQSTAFILAVNKQSSEDISF